MEKKETGPHVVKTASETGTSIPTSQLPSRKRKLAKLKEGIHKLPDKKRHLDFIAVTLTIPLLILTLILNFNNLLGKNLAARVTPSVTPAPTIIYKTNGGGNITPLIVTTKPQPTSAVSPDQCMRNIGPISIANPTEGQTVNSNPVCIDINYNAGNYCGVVWAYKINGSPLSDYSNNSVCLYNLPTGTNTFELDVKSLVSNSTQTLTRTFTYNGTSTSPSPSPSGQPSQTVTPTPTRTQ